MTVRSFKGTPLVDIREFYDKDGQLLPGKKGNIDQVLGLSFEALPPWNDYINPELWELQRLLLHLCIVCPQA